MTVEQIVFLYLLSINIITFITYGIDKALAKAQKFRISEATLLMLSFIFGSVGALLGMIVFHHKTKKKKFLIFVPLMLIAQAALLVWYFFFSNIRISILY